MDATNIEKLHKMFSEELHEWELGHTIDDKKIREMLFICKLLLYNEYIVHDNISLTNWYYGML